MGCTCAKATNEHDGWKCNITGASCIYLEPNQDSCADKFSKDELAKLLLKKDGESNETN